MPELPEVEAARRLVEEHCIGQTIVSVTVAEDPKVISGVTAGKLQEVLTGKIILHAHRKGKHLWLELDKRPWPSFQFGMTGAFVVKGVEGTKYKRAAVDDEEDWPSKWAKIHLKLDSGVEMAFTDRRRFARIHLLDDPLNESPIAELGLDSLLELPEVDEFTASLKQKKKSIKAILLDQSFLAGIGNWVADEVLYQAKLHPEQPACSLSSDDGNRLHKAIKEVMGVAVEVDANSTRFPKDWIFHYRWSRKPGTLNGNKVEFITVNGRTSAYVPAVQKYLGPPLKTTRGTSSRQRAMETGQELSEVDPGQGEKSEGAKVPGTKKKKEDASVQATETEKSQESPEHQADETLGPPGAAENVTPKGEEASGVSVKVGSRVKAGTRDRKKRTSLTPGKGIKKATPGKKELTIPRAAVKRSAALVSTTPTSNVVGKKLKPSEEPPQASTEVVDSGNLRTSTRRSKAVIETKKKVTTSKVPEFKSGGKRSRGAIEPIDSTPSKKRKTR